MACLSTHPASFRKYLFERLIHKTGISRYHLLDGDGDPQSSIRQIGSKLQSKPVDIAFAGIGENGHLAFNDPPADFQIADPYLIVDLDDACRQQQVNEGWFSKLTDVPKKGDFHVRAANPAGEGNHCGRTGHAESTCGKGVPGRGDQPHDAGVDSAKPPECDYLPRYGFGCALKSGSFHHGIIRQICLLLRKPLSRTVRPIRNLRWWIGALLFASTVINYIDRQTLSLLSPYLKQIYHWTNCDYANLLIGFRIAYSMGQSVCGRLMDRLGTRRGLTLSVLWYSIVSMATSLASGFYSFATFRFLLGAGESANWPGATKAVSEWFPKRERALATALFDSGSSIGGAVAPFIVFTIYNHWGWRPAFAIPGVLGFVWLLVWRRVYHPPKDHPRLSDTKSAK